MTACVKLHLGCGPNILPGWVNVDIDKAFAPDIVADLGCSFPLASESVDYIHTEGCLCQFNLQKGADFLKEAHRVLKPGGAMRLLTPDLKDLLKRYLDHSGNQLVELWSEKVGIPLKTGTACEVINIGVRDLHRFVYDHETLNMLLDAAGFESKQVEYGESSFDVLRNLDLRTPKDATYMYHEAVRI